MTDIDNLIENHLAYEATKAREDVEYTPARAAALHCGMFTAPQPGATPAESMTTDDILAWRQINDLDARCDLSYGPWLTDLDPERNPARERFTRRWARYLSDRGVPAHDAVADGLITSRNAGEARKMAGWPIGRHDEAWVDALIIPRRGTAVNPETRQPVINGVQIKPGDPRHVRNEAGKPMKIASPPGMKADVHVPARSRWLMMQAGGKRLTKDLTVVLTEGASEAMAIAGAGVPALSAAGVWQFHNVLREDTFVGDELPVYHDEHGRTAKVLVPTLSSLIDGWTKANVLDRVRFVVLFDHDTSANEQVQAAGTWLVRQLRDRGAQAEFRFAPEVAGDDHAGPGDFLATGRTWDELMAEATEFLVDPAVSMGDFPAIETLDREKPDLIPWSQLGGKGRWFLTKDTVDSQGLAEHFVDVAGADWAVMLIEGEKSSRVEMYSWDGRRFAPSHEMLLRQAVRRYLRYREVLADAAMASQMRTVHSVQGADGEWTVVSEAKAEKAKAEGLETHTEEIHTWPSEGVLSQYREANKRELIIRDVLSDERLSIRESDLDADPWLIGFQDGTYDARTGEFRPASRDDRLTKIANCNFPALDADALPAFSKALDALGDPEKIDRLQLRLGSAPIGIMPDDDTGFWFLGKAHAGKSTLLDLIMGALDPWAFPLPMSILTSPDETDTGYQYQLDAIRRCRFVCRDETGDTHHLSGPTFKAFFSKGAKQSRAPYGAPRKWSPGYTSGFATNQMAKITGNSEGVARRVEIYEFLFQYVKASEMTGDPNERVLDPTILPALFEHGSSNPNPDGLAAIWRWILTGVDRLRARGWTYKGNDLVLPRSMQESRDRWESSNDEVGAWLDDDVKSQPTDVEGKARAFTTNEEMYASFVGHRVAAGHKPVARATFETKLAANAAWSKLLRDGIVEEGRRTSEQGKRSGYFRVEVARRDERTGRRLHGDF